MRFDDAANGRGAWNALRSHFEGDGFRNRNVEEAYNTLETLVYEGEQKGFTFEKFSERQLECYLELSRFNEPILESKKVRDLLNRIKAPELAAAKQQIKASPHLANNFEEAINFLSLSATPIKQSQRNIAAFDQYGLGTRGCIWGRGGRGRFHGGRHDSGRSHNLGGRGRGRGFPRQQGRGGRARYTPYTGYYTQDEWNSLSASQRTRVSEAWSQTKPSQSGVVPQQRTVGALETNLTPDDTSAITMPTQISTGTTVPNSSGNSSNNAGNQFGRRARYIGMLNS
jgi:hypothetical protein